MTMHYALTYDEDLKGWVFRNRNGDRLELGSGTIRRSIFDTVTEAIESAEDEGIELDGDYNAIARHWPEASRAHA